MLENFAFWKAHRHTMKTHAKTKTKKYKRTCRAMASAVRGWSPVTITTYRGTV